MVLSVNRGSPRNVAHAYLDKQSLQSASRIILWHLTTFTWQPTATLFGMTMVTSFPSFSQNTDVNITPNRKKERETSL